jgi:hypothetical protein
VAIRAASLLSWSLAGVLSIGSAHAVQVHPPARAPDYDLAIVGVAPTWRWQGGLEESAKLDVALANRGTRDIVNEDVACTLEGRALVALNRPARPTSSPSR